MPCAGRASSGQERPTKAEIGCAGVPDLDLISRLQTTPLDAADRRAHVRRPAAEERGDVDPARDGEIGAHAEPGRGERDLVTLAYQDRLPHRQRRVIERRVQVATGDGDNVVRGGAQAASEEQDLETSIAWVAADQIAATWVVADEKIGDP